MRILVTNDDGIYSPGIRALAHTARKFGEVFVVAPDVERSGAGHAITHTRPLSFRHTTVDGLEGYRVDGTPADCVAVGLHQYDGISVVLSGINMGPNLGNSMWHSGTLAAAKQAALFGCRGIALSTPTDEGDPDFDKLEPFVEEVLKLLLADEDLLLVNVNFPREPKSLCWARQSVRQYDGHIVPGHDPRGREHYWFTVSPLEDPDEGTDRWAIEHGHVSITPLRLDLTDEHALAEARRRYPIEP
ncbi:5'/3'-nucleotidase SurE [soil metagenome]